MPRVKASRIAKVSRSSSSAKLKSDEDPASGVSMGALAMQLEILPLPAVNHTTNPEDYTFFYTTSHVQGWASQWYPTTFTSTIAIPSASKSKPAEDLKVTFPTTEHWMMLHKALLFNDLEIAREIISLCSSASPQTTKPALLHVKRLGRRVTNFSDSTWHAHRTSIVVNGNLLKYQQNPELKEKLLATGESMIVEASPRDKVWGIGRGEKRAIQDVKAGKGGDGWGLNLLGRALGEVRRKLRESTREDNQV